MAQLKGTRLWRTLRMPAELDTIYRKIGVSALNSNTTFDSCSGDCVAEITRANLDADASEDRWYRIERSGLREILSLPARGGECSDLRSLCREFESKVVARSDSVQGEEFIVNFTVRYTANYFLVNEERERHLSLFTRPQRAIYVRSRGSDDYALATQRSDITAGEIRTVFNIDTLTCKDFLTFNIEDLTRIASSSDAAAKEWLARSVLQCESSQEKSRLLELLRN